MAKEGDKPIVFAYKDIDIKEFDTLQRENNGFKDERDKERVFECDMIFISAFSIRDELREDVNEVIEQCKDGGLTMRLITADNVWTARATALRAGLITPEKADMKDVVLEGKELMTRVGGLRKIKNDFGEVIGEEIVDKNEF